MEKVKIATVIALFVMGMHSAAAQSRPAANMSFFVTSVGKGDGGNLGGLSGADAYCFRLAVAAGAGNHTWRAYLSTSGRGAINAKDRIGLGPWYNYAGVRIASDVADLHSDKNNLNKNTVLTEKGARISGRSGTPDPHDILTGSRADGTATPVPATGGRGAARGARGAAAGVRGRGTATAPPPVPDNTCRNWTSNAADGSAVVGHFDREGPGAAANSWNSAHDATGCSQETLRATGGDGLFYCFAID